MTLLQLILLFSNSQKKKKKKITAFKGWLKILAHIGETQHIETQEHNS